MCVIGLAIRNAAPMILEAGKQLLRKFARKGVSASIGVAKDALRGKDIRHSIKNRLGEAISQTINSSGQQTAVKRSRPKSTKRKTTSNSKKSRPGRWSDNQSRINRKDILS